MCGSVCVWLCVYVCECMTVCVWLCVYVCVNVCIWDDIKILLATLESGTVAYLPDIYKRIFL